VGRREGVLGSRGFGITTDMFKTYREIFEQRGTDYHRAMQQFPLARAQEFRAIIQMADISAGHIVFDMPSGGGYLGAFIAAPVRLVCVETASQFVREMHSAPGQTVVLCEDMSRMFLPDACADRIISLAGVHHLDDKPAFYREAFRLLRPDGIFCLADVRAGSPADAFLNGFVDAHNSMGHKGAFLDAATTGELATAGFEVQLQELAYHWDFDSTAQMAGYCRLMFGIDRADDEAIVAGVEQCLGYATAGGRCRMNWGLNFLRCRKPRGGRAHATGAEVP
jgi:SAM-dependent methyltransferase